MIGVDPLAERGTPEFHREQAARAMQLAREAKSAEARLKLLDLAAAFQKLADEIARKRALNDSVVPKRSG